MTEQEKAEIYPKFHDKILGYLTSRLNDTVLAEDLCADVFLKVYEKIDTFDSEKSSLSTWIYTVTRNTLTDYFRTRKVNSEIPETLAADFSVEETVANNETLELLAEGLEQLDERERNIIILHYYSGFTLTEISEKMGISYSYVKVLHNKALNSLKNYF